MLQNIYSVRAAIDTNLTSGNNFKQIYTVEMSFYLGQTPPSNILLLEKPQKKRALW